MQRIEPGDIGCVVIAENTDQQANKQNAHCQQDIVQYPPVKHPHGGQLLFAVFIHTADQGQEGFIC